MEGTKSTTDERERGLGDLALSTDLGWRNNAVDTLRSLPLFEQVVEIVHTTAKHTTINLCIVMYPVPLCVHGIANSVCVGRGRSV